MKVFANSHSICILQCGPSPSHALLPGFSPDQVPPNRVGGRIVGGYKSHRLMSRNKLQHIGHRIKMSCKEATASDHVDRFAASSVYQRTEKRLLYMGTCEAFGCDECVGPTTSLHSRVLQKPRTRRTQTLHTYPCRVVFSLSVDKQN